ncbi:MULTISPECIES: hypothetical protein [unclassified Limnobacter]|uniref:hypothetical protein n=1 Tax=unclassified Limnobacter TaxID=2630203 RepID=UPI000C5E505C|nr:MULTISPECIES: hypothetical protein [unclassified Limnobacter]MAG79738.1 hypothetical protein [Sutterellaceae bacterium]
MSNPYFDLLNVFPVRTRTPTHREMAIASAEGPQPENSLEYTNQIDIVKAIIEGEGLGSAKSALEHALQSSSTYKEWQRTMPYLKDVPNIHGFRTKPKHKNNVLLVNKEIETLGGFLPKDQILYRGGVFSPNDSLINNGPISTTTMPCVARWHAIEVSGSIAILRIAEHHKVKAFAFKTRGNQRLTHEFEVLVQNEVKLNYQNSLHHHGMDIYQYDVYLA